MVSGEKEWHCGNVQKERLGHFSFAEVSLQIQNNSQKGSIKNQWIWKGWQPLPKKYYKNTLWSMACVLRNEHSGGFKGPIYKNMVTSWLGKMDGLVNHAQFCSFSLFFVTWQFWVCTAKLKVHLLILLNFSVHHVTFANWGKLVEVERFPSYSTTE